MGTAMTSSFNVHDATGYEQLMGRWSQKLAPLFIDFSGLADGEKILDVGCGTGSLTFALARAADLGEIAAIDYSPVFVEEAIRRNADPRIKIRQADACALPFEAGTFDRALALLVLHFVPEAGGAVAEMRRVVRPGGVVAAAVWDHLGGMPGMRMMVDTVAALSEGGRQLRARYFFQPMMQPGNSTGFLFLNQRMRPDMTEAARHADAIWAHQLRVAIVARIAVEARRVPCAPRSRIELRIGKEPQTDDARSAAADADIRPGRPGAGQHGRVAGAVALPSRAGPLGPGRQREHG